MASKEAEPKEEMSLEWIQMRTELYKMQPESFGQKSMRKFKENPLVPIGTIISWYDVPIIAHNIFIVYDESFRLHGHPGCP